MSILVVCPGCKKSFQVNEKFAGKSGPCPKCKTLMKIPEKSEEIKIHGGEQFSTGGRDAAGKLVLKPIARKQFRLKPAIGVAIGAAAVVCLLVAWLGGRAGFFSHFLGASLGLLVVSPGLVLAAYTFLYDDELEPFRGKELYIRAAACAAVYLVLWGVFLYVLGAVQPEGMWEWFYIVPPFLVVGGLTGWFAFDLEPGNGFFHYAFYALVTTILAWIANCQWVHDAVRTVGM